MSDEKLTYTYNSGAGNPRMTQHETTEEARFVVVEQLPCPMPPSAQAARIRHITNCKIQPAGFIHHTAISLCISGVATIDPAHNRCFIFCMFIHAVKIEGVVCAMGLCSGCVLVYAVQWSTADSVRYLPV